MRPLAGLLALGLGLVATLVPAGARAQTHVDVSTGILLLKDGTSSTSRYVKFKSRTKLDPVANQVVPPAPGSDGDPTPAGATGGGGTFTVYNSAGSGESFAIDLPAAKWTRSGTGPLYIYGDPTGTILKIYVRPYKLYVRGGGVGWGYTLNEASQGRIAVRLKLGTGIEWCAEAPPHPPATAYDHTDRFQSAKADAPVPCPPFPGP